VPAFIKNNLILIVSIFIFGIFLYAYLGFFGSTQETIGDDYQQQLPNLLAGYYWYSDNSIFSIPWFSPAQCGGVPFYADPGHGLISLPTLLTAFVHPLSAIKITFILFALAGFVGFYFLLLKFKVSKVLALAGATLFLFNGFYIYRMVIGHPFHAFMLAPLLYLLLLGKNQPLLRIIFSGLILAYMFHSAMINILPPVILAFFVVLTIFALTNKLDKYIWLRFLGATTLGILLSISKLVASILFLKHFPRDLYQLPGFVSFQDTVVIALKSIFLRSPFELANELLVNNPFYLQQHEFEFGVTPLPAILILTATIFVIYSHIKKRSITIDSKSVLLSVTLLILFIIPLAFNFFSPSWNDFLKGIPIIGQSSSLLRWFAMYIPVTIILAILSAETLSRNFINKVVLAGFIIVFTIAYQAGAYNKFYSSQHYNPQKITEAYNSAKTKKEIPTITGIGVYTNDEGVIGFPVGRNDVLTQGASQLACYNAIFGYFNEDFPRGALDPGETLVIKDSFFNVKNPACYLYPKENNCLPGDHFREDERDKVTAFLRYESFDFQKSRIQKIADYINVIAILALLSYIVYLFTKYYKRK
jgi:hypothetical protein